MWQSCYTFREASARTASRGPRADALGVRSAAGARAGNGPRERAPVAAREQCRVRETAPPAMLQLHGTPGAHLVPRLMPHLALLGDSIFDNAAYVAGGPDVCTQLAGVLPPAWRATLAAVDGAVLTDVARQLAGVPRDVTHLVVSAGGNDALGHADLLDRPARSSAEVLGWLADAVEGFEARYRAMLGAVRARGLPVTVCTVYNGRLAPPTARTAAVALAVFNDAILRLAAEHDVPTIELRLVCTEAADYANPIEPSVVGGAKIARAIARAVGAPVP